MRKQKPLTDGGHLEQNVPGFNKKSGSIRKSIDNYNSQMKSTLLNKELMEFVGRFKWSGLPEGIDDNILETMLYVKGQLAMFILGGRYYILPFVYTGPVNHYGIQTQLIPLSYSGALETEKDKITPFAPQREVVMYDKGELNPEDIAIVLKSHSSNILSTVIPMVSLTNPIRDKLVENLMMIRNNLILSQPMKYMSVANESAEKSMRLQVDNLIYDILNGNIVNIIVGGLALDDVNTEVPKISQQDMWQSFASLDNLRMEIMGILNNGVFEKRERNLTDEVAGKQTVSRLLLDDQLEMRKKFCTLCNKYFKLNMKVELSDMNDPTLQKKDDGPIIDRREGQFNPNVEVND